MTPEIITVLLVLGAATIAFATDRWSADVVGLGTMLAIIFLGLVSPGAAFRGFGSDTVIMLLGLLIMTAALLRTGVVETIGHFIAEHAGGKKDRFLLISILSITVLSSFISNTAAVAVMLPVMFGAAVKFKAHPGEFLMPIAFASILASPVTLIATSTNIVVSDLLTRTGMAPLSLFELTPVGVPMALTGLIYLWIVGRKLVPRRGAADEGDDEFGLRPFLAELIVQDGSPFAGRSIEQSKFGERLNLMVLRVRREGHGFVEPRAWTVLREHDVLVVQGARDDLLKIKELKGLEIRADARLRDPEIDPDDLTVCEAVIGPNSPLIGRTLRSARIRERYDAQVLGINRFIDRIPARFSQMPLRLGDIVLVQGLRSSLRLLQEDGLVQLLAPITEVAPRLRRAPLAASIFAGSLVLAAVGGFGLPAAVLCGAFAMFVTGCITPDEAYRRIDWKLLVLIGSMLSLGVALEETGAAAFLAGRLIEWTGSEQPLLLLAAIFVLTVMLTQVMSNQAAAVVIVPIAVHAAAQAGVSARALVVMVALSASCSFITPLEPACLLTFGPGRYKFFDFVKVGTPLTIILFGIAMALVPAIWPLR